MRLAPIAPFAFALLGLTTLACNVTSSDPNVFPDHPSDEDRAAAPPASKVPAQSNDTPEPEPPQPSEPKNITQNPSSEKDFPEVVFVLMQEPGSSDQWFCTGTLVAQNKVVTAAHCLDPSMFATYEIVAPLAPNAPRVNASLPKLFGGPFEDVGNPDIGFLTLDTPIVLPHYAVLTDVVSRVESGEKLTTSAVVRTAEIPEAPLAMSQYLPLSSTVPYGYTHGFGTPFFSNGGDSGAGLFLVENGATTHKLVGVARQPEPDRNIDHFTRVDAEFLAWFAAN
jgi:hypothetical protein